MCFPNSMYRLHQAYGYTCIRLYLPLANIFGAWHFHRMFLCTKKFVSAWAETKMVSLAENKHFLCVPLLNKRDFSFRLLHYQIIGLVTDTSVSIIAYRIEFKVLLAGRPTKWVCLIWIITIIQSFSGVDSFWRQSLTFVASSCNRMHAKISGHCSSLLTIAYIYNI